MTNKNEFDTPDNFSTNDHVFYGDEKKGKDDFEIKDDFSEKSKTSVKDMDKAKLIKVGVILFVVIGLVISAVYFKLQKNKESRLESGVETAVAKPVTNIEGTGLSEDRFGFGGPQPIPALTEPNPLPTANEK